MATGTSSGWPATTPRPGRPGDGSCKDSNAVRFVEITVNGPKTRSLAAALNPEVAAAYDAAQDRAAEQIIGWVAEHATTRVGPRGRQVQVPVERIEAAVVRHYTSRAGDPHRHLHLQVNARVFAMGQWRGLHTVGFRDSIEALNGIGHAAVMCDPEFRAALAAAGFTLEPDTGEVAELAPFVGAFSERAAQIGRNIDRYEAEWRTANPGRNPARRCAGRGTDGRGRTRAPTRSRPGMVPNSWRPGTSSFATSATATPPPSRACRWWSAHPGSVRSTARPRWKPSRSGSAPDGRRGMPPTSAVRPRRRSPRPGSSSTRPCAPSWPRTSPSARSRRACRCCTSRVFPCTSEP
ncbi:relaxase domain-containing protein [Nocardioides sp. B-3]|uniref:relaxase domain-containing protein n=1 Tax=Nocardioides sp. B-3 TaxID=2895565 RepID=UPI0021532A90|nr:relaxase domain-containing protein [Nocardioides sp. B-3]UUZ60211.1 relaxase domain-containing protein [Nocardioides sp. B-3]